MKIFVIAAAAVVLVFLFHSEIYSQETLSERDKVLVGEARSLAEKFIERFAETREFKTVWNEFHSADDTCALEFMRLEGASAAPFSKFKESQGPGPAIKKKLFYSYWNFFLLGGAYLYSSVPTPPDRLPDPSSLPKGPGLKSIKRFESGTRFVSFLDAFGEDEEINDLRDLDQFIGEMDGFAKLFRTYMPKDVMKGENWRGFVTYMNSHSPSMIVSASGEQNPCISGHTPIYQISIADIYFLFIVENRKLRLLSLVPVSD